MTLRLTRPRVIAFCAGMATGILLFAAFFMGWFSPVFNPPLSY